MKITKIKVEPEELAELNGILNSGCSPSVKKRAMVRIAGRECTICGSVPTTLVTYDVGDSGQKAERLERYCDKCLISVTATNSIDKTIAIVEKNYHKGA